MNLSYRFRPKKKKKKNIHVARKYQKKIQRRFYFRDPLAVADDTMQKTHDHLRRDRNKYKVETSR